MTTPATRFEIYEAADGWRWRLVEEHSEKIVAHSGEAFDSQSNAERSARSLPGWAEVQHVVFVDRPE